MNLPSHNLPLHNFPHPFEAQIRTLTQLNLSDNGTTGAAEKTVMTEDIVSKGRKKFGAQDLKLWLDLEVPIIEDCNSFGAEMQNHLIKECLEAYKKCNAMQNSMMSRHT